MVKALDKADANADAFKRSIISGAIYHLGMLLGPGHVVLDGTTTKRTEELLRFSRSK